MSVSHGDDKAAALAPPIKWGADDRANLEQLLSAAYKFTQITINADDHPLMRRMHKPGDEKRSLVIVPQSSYDDWLNCQNPQLAKSFLNNYPAEGMMAIPYPTPPPIA